jgi:hypothetical protein|tara:strand:- start:225 stop:377 length:153 start_codon:yes stop_codon:yes gene_type:complete
LFISYYFRTLINIYLAKLRVRKEREREDLELVEDLTVLEKKRDKYYLRKK